MVRGLKGAAFAAAIVWASVQANAQALPAFQLRAPDGGTVGSDALPSTGRWVLIYVVPGSAPSDRLIQSLGEDWPAADAARIVIIVGADAARARSYLADKGGAALADATWYADPEHAAWGALGFQGTLGVAGVAESTVDWKIDGVIQDPTVTAPAVRAWLSR